MTQVLDQASRRQQVLVPAPPFVTYGYGIDSVLTWRGAQDAHWRSGVAWESAVCNHVVHTTEDPCALGLSAPVPDKTFGPADDGLWFHAEPFTVYAADEGGAGCRDAAERRAFVEASLEAGEQAAVEAAMFEALDAEANDLGFGTLAFALGSLENELAGGYGGRGVIWTSRLGATLLSAATLVSQSGAQLVTRLGTPVVAGFNPSEAPSSGALADAVTLYATGALMGYRSTVEVLEGFDRTINKTSTIAERTYVLGWDCGAVSVTAPTDI